MSKLQPSVIERVREEIEGRWLPDRIPEGWPPFNLDTSDGCTGVRQIAQHCCAVHDADYHYGRNWMDKLVADYRLMVCIWKAGVERAGDDASPEPWTTLPAWGLLGIGRFIGVAMFGWKAFHKVHKRKGWKPPAPPDTGESVGLE